MTIGRLLREMSSHELAEWMAYDEFDPIGAVRGDVQAGTVASAAVNLWAGKDDKRSTPLDFVPDYGGLRAEAEASRTQTASEGDWRAWAEKVAEMEAMRRGNGPGTTDAQADG